MPTRTLPRRLGPWSALLVLLTLMAAAPSAEARDDYSRRGFYAGAQIAIGVPLFDDELNRRLGAIGGGAASSAQVSPNAGFSLIGGARVNERFAAELEFEWFADYKVESPGFPTTTASSWIFSLNTKLFLATERWQPFLMLGMGAYHADLALAGTPNRIDSTSFAPRFGGGLDYYLTRHVALTSDVSYLVGTGDLNRLGTVSINFGAIYRF